MTLRRTPRELAVLAALVGVYFIAGKLGLKLAFFHPSATAVSPPTGIALAAFLLLGYRVWPAILAGAFLVNITTAGTAATSLGIASGNTLEGLIGAYLVNRFANGRHAFDRPQDIFKFTGLAAMLSTTVSATFGVTSLALGGFVRWASYGDVWLTWWLGDVVGALIVAPLVVLWSGNLRLGWSGAKLFEAALLLLSTLLVSLLVFGGLFPAENKNYELSFLSIPLGVWAAFRFGPREAASVSFLQSGIAIWGTLRGLGPFASQSPNEALLLVQSFSGVMAVTAIALAAVVSERKRFEAQLAHLADHDPLTDLFSRRRFQSELTLQLAQARRYGTHGALLFLDIDDFKYVNDRLGHATGDKLLAGLCRLLRGRIRDADLLARVGGDELGILLPHTDGDQAQAVAGHLLETIRRHAILAGDQPISITASVGIALFPRHGTTVDELLGHADLAMYQAKEEGGNRFKLYVADREWQEKIEARFKNEQSIRDALEKGLFLLYAQPILDLRQNRISQYELLLRMASEKGELVGPASFLRTAEQSGLIHPIERWVVSEAIHLIALHSRSRHDPGLSVNLSGKAFSDSQLLPMIRQELAETSINPSRLTLEITETAAISDSNHAQKFAMALKKLGCRFALDDFGVGFSSLYHLKHLPVDYLKIDGSFIRDLPHNLIDQHLVKAMVEVARALRKKTVAEFVGDQRTLELLRQCGVDYAQGYYIGRPQALSEIWSKPGRA